MRKRILCSLIAVLVAIALLPMETFAATNYSNVFANLTAADIATYNTALPAKGTKVSASQISSELSAIGYKMPGKQGPVIAENYLVFSTDNGVLDYASKYSNWYKISGKTIYNYSESVVLYTSYGTPSPDVSCEFSKVKGKTLTYYSWKLGATTGYTSQIALASSSGKAPKMTGCKKYKDVKLLGQKCFVYSYKVKGSAAVYYNYVSRKTGLTLKHVSVDPSGYVTTSVNFVQKYASKPNSYFAPPSGVTFTSSY